MKLPQNATFNPVDEDPREGAYYVSVVDGGRYALLAGPFSTHREALDLVPVVREAAYQVDPRSAFYAFGTCRLERRLDLPAGVLNGRLGL